MTATQTSPMSPEDRIFLIKAKKRLLYVMIPVILADFAIGGFFIYMYYNFEKNPMYIAVAAFCFISFIPFFLTQRFLSRKTFRNIESDLNNGIKEIISGTVISISKSDQTVKIKDRDIFVSSAFFREIKKGEAVIIHVAKESGITLRVDR